MEDLPLKVVKVAGGLLEETLRSISQEELKRAVHLLATARTIDIYGVENSRTPAEDLLTKLTFLGLNCRLHTRPLSAADLRQPSGRGRCGSGLLPLGLFHGYGQGAETGPPIWGGYGRRSPARSSLCWPGMPMCSCGPAAVRP